MNQFNLFCMNVTQMKIKTKLMMNFIYCFQEGIQYIFQLPTQVQVKINRIIKKIKQMSSQKPVVPQQKSKLDVVAD